MILESSSEQKEIMGTLFSKFFSLVEFTPRIIVGEMEMGEEEKKLSTRTRQLIWKPAHHPSHVKVGRALVEQLELPITLTLGQLVVRVSTAVRSEA